MKRFGFIVSSLLLIGILVSASVSAQQRDERLTNTSVVKLVRAGFKEKTIISIIRSRPNHFELGPDRLIELKKNGVGENIILAMLALDESVVDSDDWGDDAGFFKGVPKPGKEGSAGNPKSDGGAEIFGSGGSVESQSRSRGTNGSNEGGTYTTGSATVRILRPPTEAGSGPAKLEKTPTLNNESIIKLVDAGFSEGTIIKRIEDSPAEFDLSSTKLTDLKKHRVTDSIIAAMKAAMGDDASEKPVGTNKPGEN